MKLKDKLKYLGLKPLCGQHYIAVKPQKVFKALAGGKIANLVIPTGAQIRVSFGVLNTHLPNERNQFAGKCRASIAICHSIYGKYPKLGPHILFHYGASGHDPRFGYEANPTLAEQYLYNPRMHFTSLLSRGKTVRTGIVIPDNFNTSDDECVSGIHFFYHLDEAMSYTP